MFVLQAFPHHSIEFLLWGLPLSLNGSCLWGRWNVRGRILAHFICQFVPALWDSQSASKCQLGTVVSIRLAYPRHSSNSQLFKLMAVSSSLCSCSIKGFLPFSLFCFGARLEINQTQLLEFFSAMLLVRGPLTDWKLVQLLVRHMANRIKVNRILALKTSSGNKLSSEAKPVDLRPSGLDSLFELWHLLTVLK